MDLNNIIGEVNKMNKDQLDQLTYAIQLRKTFIGRYIARSLLPGDAVQFDAGRKGGIIQGTVVKVNIKYVKVKQNNSHVTWNVPANMLKQIRAQTA